MQPNIYTFHLSLDMKLLNEISKVDRFDGSWKAIARREGQILKQLKSIATVRSVGASTRIEGSSMTDAEVEVLIGKLDISKLEDRDSQEVAGYFEALDILSESHKEIGITESGVKNLHNILLKYSRKDAWHKGTYKQHSNAVEATAPTGEKQIVFQTTPAGFATEDAMRHLVDWYSSDTDTHPVIKAAVFVYDFLSIHPFQDGNGRLSRLLGTLLLLKAGYTWIQYVSFEHEIESRKAEYYRVLMQCQRQRPGEDIYPWVLFFLDCLCKISDQLMNKLSVQGQETNLGPKEKNVYAFIESHPGCKTGDIAESLAISIPTVKRILTNLLTQKMIIKHGAGAGTNYSL